MKGRNPTEERQTFGALLRLPYEALARRVYDGLPQDGFPDIRPAHSSVMRHIRPGGSRVSDMAERARITKQSMAYLVGSLEQAGILSLTPDPADGRAKLAVLTARGELLMETLIRRSEEVESLLAQQIGEDQMTTLRGLLVDLAAQTERLGW